MQIEPFKLERYFAQHEFTAKYLLSCSDAESMSVEDLLALEPGSKESILKTWLGYGESQGSPELRRWIAKQYKTIDHQQVLLHTGAQEPIFNLMNSVLSPNDHVIVHTPSYQSLYTVPETIGCHVDFWQARFENQWKLDLNELKKLIRPQTKLVVVNFPHNPTGWIMPTQEQLELIDVLRKNGILLLSDEVYRGIEIDTSHRLPAACDLYENAISLGVLSKAYGLAGLRLGWIATRHTEVYRKMAEYKDYTTICNSTISEALSVIAIRHADSIIERCGKIVRENWKLAEKFLEKNADRFEWVPPLGGTMIFPRAKKTFDLERFASTLLEKKNTMLITGKYFDQENCYFRLGLGRRSFSEALAQMESHLGTF